MKNMIAASVPVLAVALFFGGGGAAAQVTGAPANQSPAPGNASVATPASNGLGDDIIVTARKRDETLISVPVVVSAVSGAQLARQGIVNMDGVARVVPQLLIGPQGGAVQGGNISIRGISGPDQNPFGDQAVSFNVDGVQVAKATVRRMSDFDTSQLEVLKGPQALFFGKNSPAGIISVRTNDPTRDFEAGMKVGYEFEAHEIRTEGYVSGPLGETLGFRIAGFYDHMRGYLDDATLPTAPFNYTDDSHNPKQHEFGLRGTLKWDPSERFNARLKFNIGKLNSNGPADLTGYVSCPDGARQSGSGIDQCSVGHRNTNPGYGTVVGTIPGTLNNFRTDGQNFMHQRQILTGLEMNYNLTDKIKLTSVTGYYDLDLNQCQNYENDTSVILPSCNILKDKEFSQELRFNTDFDSRLNFTGGAYYAHTNATTGSVTYLFGGNFDLLGPGFGGPTTPALVNAYLFKQIGTAYSGYLQAQYKPIDVIELDVGGRYSYERKRLPMVRTGGGLSDGVIPGTTVLDETTEVPASILPKRKDHWTDFSPEITASYRPTNALTFFGSYKHGFLSGGFNSGSVTFNPAAYPGGVLDLSYKPQKVEGFEIGMKGDFFDRTLRVDLAAYTYKIIDQQVSDVINATNTISNAGGSRVKGVEADFTWKTPFRGFTINGNIAYNHGIYTKYPDAPCYGGQTLATGCSAAGTQDLGGTELIRAPKINVGGGADYETPINESWRFGLHGNVMHSSSYLTDASSAPNGREPGYTLVDASARVFQQSGSWELAVIGRNLTDKYYFVASSVVPFSASASGNLTDRFASFSRGREIWLQATFKFGAH
jgi:iron complex outermembrane receptor protein